METVVYLYGFAKRHPPSSSSGTSPLLFSEAGMTVLTLFAFRFGRMVRRLAGRVAEGPWCGAGRGVTRGWRWFGVGLALIWRHRGDGYLLQFTWHPNRPSRALQGIFARAMASICVHRAPRTPPDSAPGHIRSRDDFQEDYRRSATGHTRPSEPG